jgi:hypothetical protein
MRTSSTTVVLIGLSLLLTAGKCDDPQSTTDGGAADGGGGTGGGTTTCYVATQFRCHEFQNPTQEMKDDLATECSSDSGNLAAQCPTAGFGGKCTLPIPATTKGGPEVNRFYTGSDLAYDQDFCVNTANGVWSTTF